MRLEGRSKPVSFKTSLIMSAMCAAIAGCATAPAAKSNIPTPAFYTLEASALEGQPGTILRWEPAPLVTGSSFGKKHLSATLYRLLYRSTGLRGEPLAVSAVVIIPKASPPDHGRPIVAWTHPTCGVTERCAPSLSPEVARTIPGLSQLLSAGAVVVATDYPGLGTRGPHPYLLGVSEGRAALDAVRAVHAFEPAAAGTRFVLWGHSQGGHAALFAAELAEHYAPELQLLGVAAAAPATALTTLLRTPVGTAQSNGLLAMLLWSWSRTLGLQLDSMVRAEDIPNIERLATQCSTPPYAGVEQPALEPELTAPFTLMHDFTTTSPWREHLIANSPRALRGHIPVLLALGGADTLIPAHVTHAYREELCSAGTPVWTIVLPGVTHHLVALEAAPYTVTWIAQRFANQPAPDDCASEVAKHDAQTPALH